jgi:mannose-6-phosphate isomerase class I
VNEADLMDHLVKSLAPDVVFRSSGFFRKEDDILAMTFPDVTDDRIFGHMTTLDMDDFLDSEKVKEIQSEIGKMETGLVVILGAGASMIWPKPDLLLYADMARWEIQLRMRRNEAPNIGLQNAEDSFESQYKRGYFVDWRVCDRLKRRILPSCHFVIDTNNRNLPVMISAATLFEGLRQTAQRPFSVVPYFDAGPWGGQWMKETFHLDSAVSNYAWCFNCVPEENSLLLGFGTGKFETPAINVVFFFPDELLGREVRQRFGEEFPIRFDFLDTMGGGNLSLQVHPLTDYIREKFGVGYTQDESYYLVEAGDGAVVYLGLKEGIDPDAMKRDLLASERGEAPFGADDYVQRWPAVKHDHFLIPAGTIHCSGKDCMVLEISATPYIFTFKLWDWGRLGLDGKPRPINIGHGVRNIQWNRTETWVRDNLVNQIRRVAEGEGWTEEKTGLHESEFIETRRHRFRVPVLHHTGGGVNVLCLVDGREVVVESPSGRFEPFVVHFAETFIIPASVEEYTIAPSGESEGSECITVKAYVVRNFSI